MQEKPPKKVKRVVKLSGLALALVLASHALGLLPKEVLEPLVQVLAPFAYN